MPMKKALSIILVASVFLSVIGYTVPCTLHCLYMDATMEMCHHDSKSDIDCKGSCMVNKISDKKTGNTESGQTEAILLAQYRLNLISAYSGFNVPFLDPLTEESIISTTNKFSHITWIPDPLVPPPKVRPAA